MTAAESPVACVPQGVSVFANVARQDRHVLHTPVPILMSHGMRMNPALVVSAHMNLQLGVWRIIETLQYPYTGCLLRGKILHSKKYDRLDRAPLCLSNLINMHCASRKGQVTQVGLPES